MPQAYIILKLDMHEAMEFTRRLRRNKDRALRMAAEKILAWQRQRFIENMQGDGDWPELSPETVKSKKFRARRYNFTGDPNWILYESGTLLRSLGVKRTQPNQFQGYRYIVGFVNENEPAPETYRGLPVQRIAFFHHRGVGRNPQRELMVNPPTSVWRKISRELRSDLGLKPQ